MRAFLILITLALPALALAQDKIRQIPPDEWEEMTEGRTVYYYIGQEYFGREYYLPGSNAVRFEHVSGQCLEGVWTHLEESFAYCYRWPGDTPCFLHFEEGGQTLIQPVTPTGEPTGSSLQRVERIEVAPFTCGPAVTS